MSGRANSTIMCDWWCDPARLVAQPYATCLRPLAVWNLRSRVLDHRPYCDQIFSSDHPRLLWSFSRYFDNLSAILISLMSCIGRNMVVSPVWLGLKKLKTCWNNKQGTFGKIDPSVFLSNFTTATEEEISKSTKPSATKSCHLDPIKIVPIWLVACYHLYCSYLLII